MTEPVRISRAAAPEPATLDGRILRGYAAVWDAPTLIRDAGRSFTETIARGAFRKSLKARDVVCTLNHDDNQLLGRTASGTLRLAEDARGLLFEVDLPDTSDGRDVMTLAARGDLRGASFVALIDGQEWDGTASRKLTALDLIECGPVTLPAYLQTTLSVGRSADYRRKLGLRLRGRR